MTDIPVELQSAMENGRVVYRMTAGGVSSPDLRSMDAAKVYFKSGSFHRLVHELQRVSEAANNDARLVNGKSDKELEAMLKEGEPPSLLTISQ